MDDATSKPVNGAHIYCSCVYTILIIVVGKRKATEQPSEPTKKVKIADGSAAPATSSNEESTIIFVGRLSWNVDNDWLAKEFEEYGEVVSARVQMDRNTGKSRGFGFVEFKSTEAVEAAVAVSGQKEIDGRAVNIDKTAARQHNPEKRAKAFGDSPSAPSTTLFVGNVSFQTTEDGLWEIFAEFGDIKSIRLPTERDSGRPKGFGYVEFTDIETAKKAYEGAQGKEVDGRNLRLDYSTPRGEGGGGGFGGRGGGRGGRGGDSGWGGRGGGRGGGDRGGRVSFDLIILSGQILIYLAGRR